LLQPLQERPEAGLKFQIVHSRGQKHADATHPLALLRARRERPRGRRAADERDELARAQSKGRRPAVGRGHPLSNFFRWPAHRVLQDECSSDRLRVAG